MTRPRGPAMPRAAKNPQEPGSGNVMVSRALLGTVVVAAVYRSKR